MHGVSNERTLVKIAISPAQLPLTLTQAVHKLTFIDAAIYPRICTEAIGLIIGEIALVTVAYGPDICALTA